MSIFDRLFGRRPRSAWVSYRLGIEAGLYNDTDEVRGAQFGLINHAYHITGAQVGCYNRIDNEILSPGSFRGLQAGIFNAAQGETSGAQVGAVNMTDELYGLQVGLYCRAVGGMYLQLGLLTIRADDSLPWYLRYSPLVGFRKYLDIGKLYDRTR